MPLDSPETCAVYASLACPMGMVWKCDEWRKRTDGITIDSWGHIQLLPLIVQQKSFMTSCVGGVFFIYFHTSGGSITADPLAPWAPLKLLPHFASKRFCHECWPKLIEQVEVYVFHDVSDFFPAPLGQTMTSAEASLPWLVFEALKL